MQITAEADIRREMLAKRRAHADSAACAQGSARICGFIKELSEFRAAKTVMLYLPLPGEVDVTGLYTPEKTFCTPVTRGVKITPAMYAPDMELSRGEYGVAVPDAPVFINKNDVDFIIVPAVAVDRQGGRMGFGKGCYDRFLAGLGAATAAVCFDFQVTSGLSQKPHDIRPDYIITESGCIYGSN